MIGVLGRHHPEVVVAAIAIIGLALGPVFPLLISEAGRRAPHRAADAAARLSAIGYGAYLAGPPVVGFLADHIGLPTAALGVATGCAAILLNGSRRLRNTGHD